MKLTGNQALSQQQQQQHKDVCWRSVKSAAQKKPISWSFLCGLMLFGLGLISLFTGHVASDLDWYSERLIKPSLLSNLVVRHRAPIDIWKSLYSKAFYGCCDRSSSFVRPVREVLSNGYLLIGASGGLNQQRIGITDAVVVARILNATLVVPELDHQSFWKDESNFYDIFDVDWFISYLSKDVKIVKRVPDKFMRSMEKPPYTMRVPRKSSPEYYMDQVLPILLRRRVVQLTKFDYRLASILDEELQKLRCRVNYHALRFTEPIREIGQTVVTKMRDITERFIAVHLRFEHDMLAFSGCYFGGGEKERSELSEIRKRWATLPSIHDSLLLPLLNPLLHYISIKTIHNSHFPKPEEFVERILCSGKTLDALEHFGIQSTVEKKMDLSPDGERKRGKCPLTPYEVGLMLRALGFKNDTYLYVASGEIYGGEETLRPLRELFPNFYTKEMLASEELKYFLPFSSRLAAIDYIVCDESDVFITNNNGNMAKILAGRRRYMGHKRTIRPNAKKLSRLFMERDQMGWDMFSKKVKQHQRGFMGEPDEMRPGRGDFHEFPSSCICQKPFNNADYENTIIKDKQDARRLRPGTDKVTVSIEANTSDNDNYLIRKG